MSHSTVSRHSNRNIHFPGNKSNFFSHFLRHCRWLVAFHFINLRSFPHSKWNASEPNAYEWLAEWRLPCIHHIHTNYLFTISLQPLSHRFEALQSFGRLEKIHVWAAVFFRSQRSHFVSRFAHARFSFDQYSNCLAVLQFSVHCNILHTQCRYGGRDACFFSHKPSDTHTHTQNAKMAFMCQTQRFGARGRCASYRLSVEMLACKAKGLFVPVLNVPILIN